MSQNQRINPDLARAMRLFEKGDLGRAEQAAKAAHPAAPGPASQVLAGIALKRGDFEAAHAHTSSALQAAPHSAKLLLNLATIEHALQRTDAALATFERAASLAPRDFEAQLGFGKALAEQDRLEEAVAQFQRAHQIVAHPRAKGPIADAMFRLGRFAEAETWAMAALGAGLDTAELRCLIGKISLATRQPKKALESFQNALEKNPKDQDALMGLSCAHAALADVIAARDATRRLLELRPVVKVGAVEPKASIAILHQIKDGYFRRPQYGPGLAATGNFSADLQSQRTQFHHYMTPLVGRFPGQPAELHADIVLSNIVNAETLFGERLDAARAAMESFEVPVINGIDAALATSRAANAERFSDAKRFKFPKTISIERQGQSAWELARHVLEHLSLPLILRPTRTQEGRGAQLLHDENALVAEIARYKEGIIYAIEYFDCTDSNGIARRYRFAHVDGELIAANMHAVQGWNAHGESRTKLNWMNSDYRREEEAFLKDADTALGFDRTEMFAEIVEKTPLDLYGVDFGVARTGEVVIFEVNASMGLTAPRLAARYPYIQPHRDYMFGKIDDYLFRRALEARDARASA